MFYRNLVNDVECGIYVKPENIQEIANGIRKVLALSEVELKEMGESGYNYAKKHFDRELLAKEYINRIEQILNKNV